MSFLITFSSLSVTSCLHSKERFRKIYQVSITANFGILWLLNLFYSYSLLFRSMVALKTNTITTPETMKTSSLVANGKGRLGWELSRKSCPQKISATWPEWKLCGRASFTELVFIWPGSELALTWVKLKNIMLNKRNQSQKSTHYIVSFVWKVSIR